MSGDRANILCILNILKEYSDENHIMTSTDIISRFNTLYDSKIDRRTVYSAIDSLIALGYDISDFEDNRTGYFLRERDFEPAEVRLLIDAVHSFEYISQKQTDELNEKLKNLLNIHERKTLNNGLMVNPGKKSMNPQVILNIEILSDAITEAKRISFTYVDYDLDKKLKPRREEKYLVDPYAMICENKHYYLVCIYKGQSDPSLYRIDMMKDIKIEEEKRALSPKQAKLDTVKKITYAHAGAQEKITLRCDRKALRYVIEEFGSDVLIIPNKENDGGFEAVFYASPNGIIYWALQYLSHVEVIEPKSLREKVMEAVKNNKYGV